MGICDVGTQPVETQRLLLRRFIPADNASMRRRWVSDAQVQSLYSEPVYRTEGEVSALLEQYVSAYEKPHT